VLKYIQSEEGNKNEPMLLGTSEKELGDLKGFLLLITNYLVRGQRADLVGDPS
jgi:hypothetical protein